LPGARTIIALALLAGCRDRSTPEQQVRAAIAEAEQAAQDRDLRALATLISDQFQSAEGAENDKAAVIRILQLQFLRYPAIHLLVRVPGVGFPRPGRAEATVLVAMAALPIRSPADFPTVNADLYQFDLVLVEEGRRSWKVRSAAWKPVRIQDF
jgi:hypothetical protein